MANIVMSLPSSVLANTKKKEEEKITYQASSLNSAYHQLKEHGLVVVTNDFSKLSKGPKMEVFQGEKLLGTWGLIKAAVKRPAKGVIREGENWPAKSLTGPISSSSMIPLNIVSYPKVVISCKRRRRQKLKRAKEIKLVIRSLFCMSKKKKKKRGKRSKKNKVGKDDFDAKELVGDRNVVGKSGQKKKGFPNVKSEANKDFDRDAKVCQHYHRSLVSLS